jgi:hypothetical protein
MTTRRADLHDMIHELTQPTQHHEPYWLTLTGQTRQHTTTNPPLITQLHNAAQPLATINAGSNPATSRPSASIDALDTLNRIHTQAGNWLHDLGHDHTGTTIERISRLGPTAANNHCHQPKPRPGCCPHHDIERWWTWARITTGWDQPAFNPNNTCPTCGTRGTIRIRLQDHIATCTNDTCRATWNQATIGLLAEHIKAENGEAEAS